MYLRQGQPEKEKAIYDAAISRRPHAWQPRWWLASWYFRYSRVDESIAAFREMVRRAPQLSMGFSSLGGVLVQHGDYAAAIDTLRHSIELFPSRFAYNNLGTAYFNSGRFTEAVDAYNQSFQFGEADYASWLNLGDAYYFLRGRKDQAADAYRQAVRIGRDSLAASARRGGSFNVMIPANLATVFPKLGQPDSARVWLFRALAADSSNPSVRYCAALTWWQLHDEPRAIAALQQAVAAGYPVVWIRDSPMFRDWRRVAEYRALVEGANPASQQAASRNPGEKP